MAVSPSYPETRFTLALSQKYMIHGLSVSGLSPVHGAQIEFNVHFTTDLHTHFVAILSYVL